MMVRAEELEERHAEVAERLHISERMVLHQALDKAVIKAYGWKATMRPNDLLEVLYRLNKERGVEEQAGKVRWLRPDKQKTAGTKLLLN